jgi:hypothetical protein
MRVLTLIATALALGTLIAFATASADVAPSRTLRTPVRAVRTPAVDVHAASAPGLDACLFDAMVAWRRLPDCEREDCTRWEAAHHEPAPAARARYAEIASEIAPAPHALDLLAIAFMESGFERLVDDGSCNTTILRGLGYNCDGGLAHTIFQIHDASLTPGDRPRAVRVAADLFARAPLAWTTWPRARELASRWRREHPCAVAVGPRAHALASETPPPSLDASPVAW